MKSLACKKPPKQEREQKILLGLVELYLKMGKPIGSNTLKDYGFSYLSSATIRNYFSRLEKQGFLHQAHSSGGRVPTDLAFQCYASHYLKEKMDPELEKSHLFAPLKMQTEQIGDYLTEATEILSELTNCAVFLSSPRFDQDFIQDIRLLRIDLHKVLCILISHFGLIQTQTVYLPEDIDDLQSIQNYFLWRMSKISEKPFFPNELYAKWAQRLYNEMMIRHVAGYTNFFKQDLYNAGLSRLLTYEEFSNPEILAKGLFLFENPQIMQSIANETMKCNQLSYWIGKELDIFSGNISECSIITIPYHIQNKVAGSIAILGPKRILYRKLFSTLRIFSHYLSEALTKNTIKFKISFRQPSETIQQIYQTNQILLEDRSH